MSFVSPAHVGGGNVYVVNISPAVGVSLDVNQTAVALYKNGVAKDDARALQKQDVDSEALPFLTEEVLKGMGVPTFGRRVKVLKAAHAILSGAVVAPASAASPANPSASPVNLRAPPQAASAYAASPSPSPPAATQQARKPSPEPAAADDDGPQTNTRLLEIAASAGADDDAGEADTGDAEDEEREYVNPKLLEIEQKEAAAAAKAAAKAANGGEDDLFAAEEADQGDSFMAVKPWLGAIKEPSNPPKADLSAPSKKLKIDWVHGYRAFDSRSNLVYNAEGQAVYPTAGLCVVYSSADKKQRYFQGHDDDIRCLAVSPKEPNLMVSGQNATVVNGKSQPPSIYVWDSSNPEGGKALKMKCEASDRAIRAVTFSADGKMLFSVSNDDNHTVKVWNWSKGVKVADAKGDPSPITGVRANPKDASEFVTVGQRHFTLWKFDGTTVKGKKATMSGGKPLTFFCAAYVADSPGTVLGGAEDGNVWIFKGGAAAKSIPFHPKGKVLTLEPLPQGGYVSGGSDKTVRIWDAKFQQLAVHTMGEHVVSVWPSASGDNLLVGTKAGDVLELKNFMNMSPLTGDADLKDEVVTRGHKEGELWAIASLSNGKGFVTAGEDNTICTWDIRHRLIKRAAISDKKGSSPAIKKASTTSTYPTNQCARGLAISPDKKNIVVGTNNGEVAVFDLQLNRLQVVDLNSHGKRNVTNQTGNWIEVIAFSPSGRTCAVGTHGMVVCLLDVANNYKCKAVLKSSQAAITCIDWSEDGSYLQTVDLAYELLRYSVDEDNLSSAKQVPSATATRDVAWATHTCKFGWPVQGVFSGAQMGSDIKGCDVSPSRSLVVTGDTDGNVKLYRYPCLTGAKANSYGGHSSFVVRTRFTPDEKFVLTTGGHDLSIIQWAIV